MGAQPTTIMAKEGFGMNHRENVIKTYRDILKMMDRPVKQASEARLAIMFAKAVVGMSRLYHIPLKEFYS